MAMTKTTNTVPIDTNTNNDTNNALLSPIYEGHIFKNQTTNHNHNHVTNAKNIALSLFQNANKTPKNNTNPLTISQPESESPKSNIQGISPVSKMDLDFQRKNTKPVILHKKNMKKNKTKIKTNHITNDEFPNIQHKTTTHITIQKMHRKKNRKKRGEINQSYYKKKNHHPYYNENNANSDSEYVQAKVNKLIIEVPDDPNRIYKKWKRNKNMKKIKTNRITIYNNFDLENNWKNRGRVNSYPPTTEKTNHITINDRPHDQYDDHQSSDSDESEKCVDQSNDWIQSRSQSNLLCQKLFLNEKINGKNGKKIMIKTNMKKKNAQENDNNNNNERVEIFGLQNYLNLKYKMKKKKKNKKKKNRKTLKNGFEEKTTDFYNESCSQNQEDLNGYHEARNGFDIQSFSDSSNHNGIEKQKQKKKKKKSNYLDL